MSRLVDIFRYLFFLSTAMKDKFFQEHPKPVSKHPLYFSLSKCIYYICSYIHIYSHINCKSIQKGNALSAQVSCKSAPVFINAVFRICLLSATTANSLTNSLKQKRGYCDRTDVALANSSLGYLIA